MQGSSTRVALLALGVLAALSSPALAQPSPAPPAVIDGPGTAIAGLGGLSVARDGTGGLVYLKTVSGVQRVFVSALVGGRFQTPVQVDAGLAAASSQPVIAAGNGGVLLIGFINSGQLYVADRASTTGSFGLPQPLAGGASNPSLEMTNFGKGYLAFTVVDGAGHDIRAAYYTGGTWALESAPLNAVPADDAGTGSGAPSVAAAGDGVAIVAWGEGGHVFTRRVWGTAPSIVDEQADVSSVSGCAEVSAGGPAVAAGGDSSYADVAFQEVLSCGGALQSRVLVGQLVGSEYNGVSPSDGLSSPGAEGADQPKVAMTEYGAGFVTSARETSDDVVAMELGNNGAMGPVAQINSLAAASPPYAVPAVAGLFSDLITWQQNPGSAGPAEIRVRYQPRNATLDPELVVSSPSQGPTDAARGLVASGDSGGDAAIAWVQGSPAATEIVVDQLYEPPGSAAPAKSFLYSRGARPLLTWSPASAGWGPITYSVKVDGIVVAQTAADSIRVPAALIDGTHGWQVVAINPAGLTNSSKAARVFVDTVAPLLTVTGSNSVPVETPVALRLRYRDVPPHGLPTSAASGVEELTIRWGDRTVTHIKPATHRIVHSYGRAGRYTITVTVSDRAGNRRTAVRHVRIGKTARPSGNSHHVARRG
jgi:hypothetical protein